MNVAIPNWQEAMLKKHWSKQEYMSKLRAFMDKERDTSFLIRQALKNGQTDKAQQLILAVKKSSAELGMESLSEMAFALEMAVKAKVDTTTSLNHFETALTDAFLDISAFLSAD